MVKINSEIGIKLRSTIFKIWDYLTFLKFTLDDLDGYYTPFNPH